MVGNNHESNFESNKFVLITIIPVCLFLFTVLVGPILQLGSQKCLVLLELFNKDLKFTN